MERLRRVREQVLHAPRRETFRAGRQAQAPLREINHQRAHEADEKHQDRPVQNRDQAVPDVVPRRLEDVVVRPAECVERVAPFGAQRRIHQGIADEPDQQHRLPEAQEQHDRPGDPVQHVADQGDQMQEAVEDGQEDNQSDEDERHERSGQVRHVTGHHEPEGFDQPRPILAGQLYGGQTSDRPAEEPPGHEGPQRHQQQIDAVAEAATLGADEVDDRPEKLHQRLNQGGQPFGDPPAEEFATRRLVILISDEQVRVRSPVLVPRIHAELARQTLPLFRSFPVAGAGQAIEPDIAGHVAVVMLPGQLAGLLLAHPLFFEVGGRIIARPPRLGAHAEEDERHEVSVPIGDVVGPQVVPVLHNVVEPLEAPPHGRRQR